MNFKQRIEALKSTTKSADVVSICNEALNKYNEYNHFNLSTEMFKVFEASIFDSIKNRLKNTSDINAKDFILVENYIQSINNLGVKDTINAIKKTELIKDPKSLYVIESVLKSANIPEWSSIEYVIERLQPFKWHTIINECLLTLESNLNNFHEDIQIYKALDACNKAKVDYFVESNQQYIYNYLLFKTNENKRLLLEQLEKYTYEPTIKNLYDIIDNKKDVVVNTVKESVKIKEEYKNKSSRTTEFTKRVETLINTTKSLSAIDICKEALDVYNSYSGYNNDLQAFEQFENSVANHLLEKLQNEYDADVQKFITVESRISRLKDLGVRRAINAIRNTELVKNPTTLYTVESLQQYLNLPEYQSIYPVIEKIKGLKWHNVVQEHLTALEINLSKYKEDILIYKTLQEGKNSTSNFILSAINSDLDNYLINRTQSSKTRLLEKLNNFKHDANIRNLYNIILESNTGFNIKASSSDVVVKNVYSPVIVTDNSEIFAIRGKDFVKTNNTVRPLTEKESNSLSDNFKTVSRFLAQSNVSVSENKITVFDRNHKIVISESDGSTVDITVNNNKVTPSEFKQIYLKSGMFNTTSMDIINNVNTVVENWHSIFDIDYVKTISPNHATNRRMDVFKIGHEIFINREDDLVKESIFYSNCNATQAKHMVLEFTNYDLSNTFQDMLSEESKYIKMFEDSKTKLFNVIENLQSRKTKLINIEDKSIRESNEVQELISIINEEIEKVKKEYSKLNNEYKKFMTMQEGYSTGDMVEYLSKKGIITGKNSVDNSVVIEFNDGTTAIADCNNIKMIKKSSESTPGNDLELNTQGDGASVGIRESKKK